MMPSTVKLMSALFLMVLLSACQQTTGLETPAPDGHTSQNALDWSGVYVGVLPCASCPGIRTLITIDKAGQFLKQAHYINTQGEYIERGQIQWQDNGTVIHLMGDDVDAVNYYKVVENALLHLNADKQVIGGDMAKFYRLEKITMTLQNTNWQLTDVVNVAFKSEVLSRVTMKFDDQGRLNGRAPCNQFFADYQTSEDSLLLERVGSTKMACEYMHEEQQFFNTLGQVAGYEIHLNELILKDTDKQPLLRFMAKVDKNLTKSKD